MWIGIEEDDAPHRRMVVRPIAGAIARRIVCELRPGDVLARGEKFGMIKLGSRTELIVPDDEGLAIEVSVGQRVKAGSTVMARYRRAVIAAPALSGRGDMRHGPVVTEGVW